MQVPLNPETPFAHLGSKDGIDEPRLPLDKRGVPNKESVLQLFLGSTVSTFEMHRYHNIERCMNFKMVRVGSILFLLRHSKWLTSNHAG